MKLLSKISIYFLILFLFQCNPNAQMKRPEGVPKEAVFDRKKNIFTYSKDQRELIWYENGKLYSECELSNIGMRNGLCNYYSEFTGELLSKGNFVNNLKDGLWIWNFPNGNIYYKQNFNHSKRRTDFWMETNLLGNEHGSYERYYEDGKLEEKGEYDTGYKSGNWTKYYRNGNLEYAGSYSEDKKIGIWKFYYPDGKLEAEEEFNSKTEFISRITYFPNGDLSCKNFAGKTLECR